MLKRTPPLLSDETYALLDHLEIAALADADGNGSATQLCSELSLAGSDDAIDDETEEYDPIVATESERIEGIVHAVFTEAEGRIKLCGTGNYPFLLRDKALLNEDKEQDRIYTFLLLLSAFGESAIRHIDAAKLFEDVSAHAARIYFGSDREPASSFIFGFPRRIGPRDFPSALDALCRQHLKEGTPDKNMPGAESMKDAGLDIVTWKPFLDGRASKFIAFGQCATGKNWREKRHELQPIAWCNTWLQKQPCVSPSKMFFVPHAVSEKDWAALGYQSGIVFDRLRIAHLAEKNLPKVIRSKIQKWNLAILKVLRKTNRRKAQN